jgi:PAS domain S-box-containing protein
MATSAEFVHAESAVRNFADMVLDGLPEAVLLVDTYPPHKPVVLANAAAGRWFADSACSDELLGSSLYDWLDALDASELDETLASLSRLQPSQSRPLTWRAARGDLTRIVTEFKTLEGAPGQRLVLFSLGATSLPGQLQSAFDALPLDMWILDRNLNITYANPAAIRGCQNGVDPMLGCSALTVRPTNLVGIDVYRRALAGDACVSAPLELDPADQATRWLEIRLQPLLSESGVVGVMALASDITARLEAERPPRQRDLVGQSLRVFGSLQDIQAEKRARMELEGPTDWLRLSLHMSELRAWRWNRAEDVLEIVVLRGKSARFVRVEQGVRGLLSRLHPHDRDNVADALDRAVRSGEELRQEFRLRAEGGGYRVYATTARALTSESGASIGLVGVTQDITMRRAAELQLRHSEELLRATTDNAADTLMLLDTELQVRFVNKALHGNAVAQMIGRPIQQALPPGAADLIVGNLRRLLLTGDAACFEYEDDSNGTQIEYFEQRAVLIRNDGVETGISLAIRNVTDRKRLEGEILAVSSRERQRIGRDLHDGLGQELTGIALMLRGLTRRIEQQCPDMFEAANEIVGLINQSIDGVRSLSRGLLPVSTEQGGLIVALQQLAARAGNLYALDVRFCAEIWPELRLDEVKRGHLYRIAQEAVTNAARHSQATQIDISLQVSEQRYCLKVADDGIGIPNLDSGQSSGLGMRIMAYRAGIVGARLEIDSKAPCGTLIQLTGDQPPSATAV